jgi:hypothetical protein
MQWRFGRGFRCGARLPDLVCRRVERRLPLRWGNQGMKARPSSSSQYLTRSFVRSVADVEHVLDADDPLPQILSNPLGSGSRRQSNSGAGNNCGGRLLYHLRIKCIHSVAYVCTFLFHRSSLHEGTSHSVFFFPACFSDHREWECTRAANRV